MTSTVLAALHDSLRHAAGTGGDQIPPAAIVWPDEDRMWEEAIDLIGERTVVLVLGNYEPSKRTGPAYWIRCALAGQVEGIDLGGTTPIIYLPGVGREQFRAAEDCPERLKPLVELQYRGVFWSQPNGKDWTPFAFLRNRDRGLGVEIAGDDVTLEALSATLPVLLDQPVEWLERKQPINAAALNSLVQPDPVKTLLEWLDSPEVSRNRLSSAQWGAFKTSCVADYGFNPEKDGEIHAAGMLAKRDGDWRTVWMRYREAPSRYPGIEDRLRSAAPTAQGTLAFDDQSPDFTSRDAWPQHNEKAEESLRSSLKGLAQVTVEAARHRIDELEKEHGVRRLWVWADLGRAPLAGALHHLSQLASNIELPPGNTVEELTAWYLLAGWKADDAALSALGSVNEMQDIAAVETAVKVLYAGWLDSVCRRFQEAVDSSLASYSSPEPSELPAGTCLLFTDGLRYDLGVRLAGQLVERGMSVDLGSHLAALPTITSTAKPALAPVAAEFAGGGGLSPTTEAGTDVGPAQLRSALIKGGNQVLDPSETGDPSKTAWTELGNIDKHGHNFGTRLADAARAELTQIVGRVQMLLDAGWQRVEIVTDHGFLLLPGNLEKVELPAHLVEKRKGRCARLNDHHGVDQPTVAWRWDADVRFAVARGAACFEAGKAYEHGGLSLQECVVPRIAVQAAAVSEEAAITTARWAGLRVRVETTGAVASIDVRTKPADPSTSLLNGQETVESGKASAVVPEPEAEGAAAVIVALSSDGRLLAQHPTVVGEA